MHDVIYNEMVDANIDIAIDNCIFIYFDDNQIKEPEWFGMKQSIKITNLVDSV